MKYLVLLLTVIALLFFINACDKIEGQYKQAVVADTSSIDTSNIVPKRKILLEDFTAHKCPNCPAASRIARDLKNT